MTENIPPATMRMAEVDGLPRMFVQCPVCAVWIPCFDEEGREKIGTNEYTRHWEQAHG